MKGRAIAFLLIFALICGAFGFMSADLSASARDYALEGELLAGSREAAEGIALEYAQWLHGCLVWRTAYDLGSGGQTLDFAWWPSLEEPETRPFELEAEDVFDRFAVGPGSEYSPAIAGLVDGFLESGKLSEEYVLNDYVDCVPVVFSLLVPDEGGGAWVRTQQALSELFFVPLPENIRVRFERDEGSGFYDYKYAGRGLTARASSVETAGYIYFTFSVRESLSGENELRFEGGPLLDGSHLPGGGWGLWRVKLEGEELAFESLEQVLSLGTDWQDAVLALDGERPLLLTLADGCVTLRALDAESGAVTDEFTLFEGFEPSWDGLAELEVQSFPEGIAVADRDGAAATLLRSGEGYTGLRLWDSQAEYDERSRLLGLGPEGSFYAYERRYRLFGERLAVLELTDIYSGSNRQAQGLLLLYVYDPEDGLIFAERLSSPLSGVSQYVGSETALVPAEQRSAK